MHHEYFTNHQNAGTTLFPSGFTSITLHSVSLLILYHWRLHGHSAFFGESSLVELFTPFEIRNWPGGLLHYVVHNADDYSGSTEHFRVLVVLSLPPGWRKDHHWWVDRKILKKLNGLRLTFPLSSMVLANRLALSNGMLKVILLLSYRELLDQVASKHFFREFRPSRKDWNSFYFFLARIENSSSSRTKVLLNLSNCSIYSTKSPSCSQRS
jgi:hypothetical protein